MAVVSRQGVSVTTTATRLDQDPTDGVGGLSLVVIAQAAGTLITGPAGVTAGNGARHTVVAGTEIPFELDPGEALYGVVASGSLAVDVQMAGA